MKNSNTEYNYEVEICEGCERQTYIVNRTRMICSDCNCKRLHGMSLKERQLSQWKAQQIRAKERQQSKPTPQHKKPVKKIPFFSEKGKERHTQLLKVKNEVRQQAFDNNEYYCRGCSKAVPLDCSHNIGLGQSLERATDYENLVLLCRPCHAKYESNDPILMNQLVCIDNILEYLMLNNPEKYHKKMYKLR